MLSTKKTIQLFSKFLFILVIGLTASKTYSQTYTSVVRGTVIDSLSKVPLTDVYVVASSAENVDTFSTRSKDDGSFRLAVSEMEYSIIMLKENYEPKIISVNTKENHVTNLDTVILKKNSILLDEVEITGRKSVVKPTLNGLIFTVDSVDNKGLSTLDVLKKVPLIMVDGLNNITLLGEQNYQVLIDGKVSPFLSGNIALTLKTIPSDQIKAIEIITNPSSKYEAEGVKRLINIITKKNVIDGYTGHATADYNEQYGGGGGAFIAVQKKKLTISALINGNKLKERTEPYESQTLTSTSEMLQNGELRSSDDGYNIVGGVTYDIDSLNLITGSYGYNKRNEEKKLDLHNYNWFTENIQAFAFRQQNLNKIKKESTDINLSYEHKFKKDTRRFFSLLYRYFDLKSNESNDLDFSEQTNSSEQNFLQLSAFDFREQTFQGDYTYPIKKDAKIDFGGKILLRDNDVNFDNRYIDVPNLTLFKQQQNILALYNTFSFSLKKNLGFNIGGRIENTSDEITSSDKQSLIDRSYTNFIPSVSAIKTFKSSSISLDYAMKIVRPSIWQLSPYEDRSNSNIVYRGNPNLDPSKYHTFEATYNNFSNGFYMLKASYEYSNNTIEFINQAENDSTIIASYMNLGQVHQKSLNVYLNRQLGKKVSLSLNGQISHVSLSGFIVSQEIHNSGFQGNGNLDLNWSLTNKVKVNAFAGVTSSKVLLQGSINPYIFSTFSITKDFWDDFTLTLTASNPFKRYYKVKTFLESENFSRSTYNYNIYRSFSINISYKFGNLNKKTRETERKIENDDITLPNVK